MRFPGKLFSQCRHCRFWLFLDTLSSMGGKISVFRVLFYSEILLSIVILFESAQNLPRLFSFSIKIVALSTNNSGILDFCISATIEQEHESRRRTFECLANYSSCLSIT